MTEGVQPVATKRAPRWPIVFVLGLVAAVGLILWVMLGGQMPDLGGLFGGGAAPSLSPTAMTELRQAAESKDADAEFLLATLYRNGDGVARDPDRAFDLAGQSAGQGNANGETLLGVLYQNGEGTPRNMASAARSFEAAANQGDPWAQSILGGIYLSGDGIARDPAAAYKWLSLAASNGSPAAKSFLDAVRPSFTPDELREGQSGAGQITARLAGQSRN